MGSCLTNPFISAAALLSLIVTGCSSHRSLSSGSMPGYRGGPTGVYYSNTIPTTGQRAYSGQARQGTLVSAPALVPRKAPLTLLSEVRVHKDYLPKSARGRRGQSSMRPRYITIHSTQNWSKGADPWRHSLALKRSKLGSLSWHYTIDQNVAVQHLPTNITGRHADFNGPGNKYSIGLEMCEHKGNSRSRTIDRTAKLAAYLMYKHGIPLSKVVPHYHWPRRGMNPPHKNCPHFLLDNGRPGRKWRGFQGRVKYYHDLITVQGPSVAVR